MYDIPKIGTHAEEAKNRHSISELQIINTWHFGSAERSRKGCWRIVGDEITLVLNKVGDFVITMYPNKKRDFPKAITAIRNRDKGKRVSRHNLST